MRLNELDQARLDGKLGKAMQFAMQTIVTAAHIDQAELATTMEQAVATTRAMDRVLMWNYFEIPLNVVDRPRTVYWD